MNARVMALTGSLALMTAVTMSISHAQEPTVRIQHYTHAGCDIGGRRYIPAGADTGLVATFRYPEGKQQCLDAIKRMQAGCEMATHFQATNPDGHPWGSGKKNPRCLEAFRREIPKCVEHYERQVPKCEGPVRGSTLEPFGPNWIVARNQPCQVYILSPEPGEAVTWSGGCVDGKADGSGLLVWRLSGRVESYQGEMRAGRLHGQGTFHHSDDTRYKGAFRDGKKQGHGVLTIPGGGSYVGGFHDDTFHGRGLFILPDGTRYEGEVRHGKAHGRGHYTFPDGISTYVGDFQDSVFHGHGKYKRRDGSRFEGAYRNGKPNGYGTFVGSDGLRLEGTWTDGCFRKEMGGAVQVGAVNTTPAACGIE